MKIMSYSDGHFCVNCKRYELIKEQIRGRHAIYNHETCLHCSAHSIDMIQKKTVEVLRKQLDATRLK